MGVNSEVRPGVHCLLWDFDDKRLVVVEKWLLEIQQEYALPSIYLMKSGGKGGFHAYCLKLVSWRSAVEIVARTQGVCWQFVRFGVLRGKFTLRITGKNGVWPRRVGVLRGSVPEEVKLEELSSFVRYESW